MRVTRLEIFGFKSFVERFVLNFDRNMLGIVGPNGCGKSNIVDALRWVLGETYAKQLRGTVLDDLIFNGSESRRPLGMAEVSITIRPTDGWERSVELLPESLDEDSVLPSPQNVDGDAEVDSEVAVDEAPAVESRGDSVVDIQQYNPRPAIFSEAPGLLGAAEIQFTRRLYRSGESEYFINRVPCRLRDMVDIYRLIGLGARGLSIVQQGEVGQLISKKPVERRELLEEAAGISGFRTRMEAAQRKLERTAENMARLRDIILEVEKQVRSLSRQAKRARDRNELKSELRQYDYDLFAARSARVHLQQKHHRSVLESLEAELDRARNELTLSEARQSELQSQLETFEVDLSDRRRERDSLQHTMNAERNRVNELRLELALLTERLEATQRAEKRLDERKAALLAEIEERRGRRGELSAALDAVNERKAAAEQALLEIQERAKEGAGEQLTFDPAANGAGTELLREIDSIQGELEKMPEVESALRVLEARVKASDEERRRSENELQRERVRMASIQSEVRSLSSQLEALAEQVVRATHAESESLPGLNKVLLAGITMSEDLQRPVSAILGEKGQYLVSASASELGSQLARARRERSGENQKLGVIDERCDVPAELPRLSPEEQALAPSAALLLSRLEVQEEFLAPAKLFLGSFFLVDTLEEALAVNDENRRAGRALRSFVTIAGELVLPWGWQTTDGKGLAFSFTRRIAEQQEAATSLEAKIHSMEEGIVGLESALSEVKREQVAKLEERERMLSLQKRLVHLKREEQELERKYRQAVLDEQRRRREQLAQEERRAQGDLRNLVTELSRSEQELRYSDRKVEDLVRDVDGLEGQRQALEQEREVIREKQGTLEHALGAGGTVDVDALAERAKGLDEALRELESQRNPVRMSLSEESESVARARREVNQFQDQLNKTTLEIEKYSLELKMLGEDLARLYPDSEPPTEAEMEAVTIRAEGNLDAFITEAQEEAVRIRKRIEREGEVDPQSIELFEQEEARLVSMQTQYADLESASQILERTIRQLKEISKTRFIETFAFVSKKFAELIPRLFGGGAGHLALVNPEDPLESGVEIFVRPPGKKISNMELLSGGEKALVAVAVLISMFLHRPSPICVLDEVDAPLDEANLERYLGLIAEISSNTQFLIITHNKRTMAQVQRLIGITMQERGVSTALTVSLEDSEEEINRWIANA